MIKNNLYKVEYFNRSERYIAANDLLSLFDTLMHSKDVDDICNIIFISDDCNTVDDNKVYSVIAKINGGPVNPPVIKDTDLEQYDNLTKEEADNKFNLLKEKYSKDKNIIYDFRNEVWFGEDKMDEAPIVLFKIKDKRKLI